MQSLLAGFVELDRHQSVCMRVGARDHGGGGWQERKEQGGKAPSHPSFRNSWREVADEIRYTYCKLISYDAKTSNPRCALFHPSLGDCNWRNSIFSLLALWSHKNWPPSIKMEQIENFLNKMGLRGCNWSSLNAPATENLLSHSLLKLGDFPFLTISPLG